MCRTVRRIGAKRCLILVAPTAGARRPTVNGCGRQPPPHRCMFALLLYVCFVSVSRANGDCAKCTDDFAQSCGSIADDGRAIAATFDVGTSGRASTTSFHVGTSRFAATRG